eukprot:augustus_masked-scaffold_64-processed-gene-0.23-mRNA-1 protein AED:1.00 eAED:1.00 QI:0/0/0/0/1/1/2/0/152
MFVNDISILNVEVDLEDLNKTKKVYDENRIAFLSPWYRNNFKKPSDSKFMDLQRKHLEEKVKDLVVKNSKIWIPWDDDFMCRLIITNHILAYDTTLELRLRRNKRYNDKLKGPVIQYSVGDWILLSKSGTKASQVNYLPLFVGPYHIIKIIG